MNQKPVEAMTIGELVDFERSYNEWLYQASLEWTYQQTIDMMRRDRDELRAELARRAGEAKTCD